MRELVVDDADLTTSLAARLANKSPGTIRVWANTGRLRCRRTASGVRLFTREDVVAAVKAQRGGRGKR